MDRLQENWLQGLFAFMALATVVCSIGVVVTQNVVRAAVWLLFALSSTAGLFFLLGADFVGATQLLIYVGGTLILVIFGVMLTARGPFVRMQTPSGEWTIAAVVGVTLFGLVGGIAASTQWPKMDWGDTSKIEGKNSPTTVDLGMEFLGVPPQDLPRDAAGAPTSSRVTGRDPANIGYLLPFEIVSVHLLVVLIGAAYLARAKRRKAVAA